MLKTNKQLLVGVTLSVTLCNCRNNFCIESTLESFHVDTVKSNSQNRHVNWQKYVGLFPCHFSLEILNWTEEASTSLSAYAIFWKAIM